MPRQSTPRTVGKDARRETQAQPRASATSSQQSVLDLQQGVGNSLTGQIVQRSAPVIRRAGDKLAFERGTELGEDEHLATRVSKLIERHREDKRDTKDRLEKRKEREIGLNDLLSSAEGTIISSRSKRLGVPPEIAKLRKERNEASTITEHKKTLAKYHDDVQARSGWRWERMKGELSAIKGIKFGDEPRDGKVEITASESGRTIYTIRFGTERFNADADEGREDKADNVFTKRGYSPTMKPKQFVKDDNGVHTRRFVTRAITLWHVAAMFGLNLKPKKGGGTDVEPAYADEARTKRLDAQLPRYTGDEFGAHGDTFDVGKASAYVPSGDGRDTEFRRYRHDRVGGGKGKRTQYELTKGTSRNRSRHSAMELNERASMQVRNGSGPNQPFLSTASAQIDPSRRPKVIRANKGERFDTGAENQGIVKVDLAKAQKLGIKIVNQHADESDRHKIAWDRFYDPGDLKKLSERYKLALKYPDYAGEIRPQWDEVSMFTLEERRALRAGTPNEVSNRKYVKRSAPEELDEYIYSARKNREVLMDKIPIGCVTEINLNADKGKWPNLAGVQRGEWLEFTPDLQAKLKAYLRGTETEEVADEKYDNIQAMYERAEEDKKAEGGSRT